MSRVSQNAFKSQRIGKLWKYKCLRQQHNCWTMFTFKWMIYIISMICFFFHCKLLKMHQTAKCKYSPSNIFVLTIGYVDPHYFLLSVWLYRRMVQIHWSINYALQIPKIQISVITSLWVNLTEVCPGKSDCKITRCTIHQTHMRNEKAKIALLDLISSQI